ncbi:cytochrome c oxidase accessory protein CcoG [Campylobacterota bacterium]|nr:cytochrome c oxidase accessory protein CcoG [Campylobacterota bacterium]
MNFPPYRKMRYVVMTFATILTVALPFVKIGDNHLFLLSFDHSCLHLLFVRFEVQEFYLMPFVLMFAFLFVLAVTTLGGRVWCGWGCPQTIYRVIFRDLIEGKLLGMHKMTNRQKPTDYSSSANKLKKVVAIALWIPLAFLAAANFSWFFVPPEEFFVYMQNPAEHPVLLGMLLLIAGALILDVTLIGEKFCTVICPYVRVQSSMYDRDTIYTIYDAKRGGQIYDENIKLGKKPIGASDECTGCEACVAVCPTHIDIRKGLQLECINCLECADACKIVMNKLGKPSLIHWTSARESSGEGATRFLRFRTIAYAVILAIVFVVLVLRGGEKEAFLLNINKEQRPYKIESIGDKKVVSNVYKFLFTNTSETAHNYRFEIVTPSGLQIVTPTKAIEIGADKKEMAIVEISAIDPSLIEPSLAGAEMSRIEMIIRAYAEDDPKQAITRKALFFYPPQRELE